LDIALKHRSRFVLASTSEVYGDPLEHPQRETYWGNVNTVGIRSVYDESKRFAEALVTAFRRFRGLPTGIVRIFNTYGPRMRPDDGRAVPTFIAQALATKPLTVRGDGTQTRSFCYIDDLVAGLLAFAESDEPGPVNMGNPAETTVRDLAGLIVELCGAGRRVTYSPLGADDPKRRRPDITLAPALLGWEPRIDLRTGLTRTIEYFRDNPPAGPSATRRPQGPTRDSV